MLTKEQDESPANTLVRHVDDYDLQRFLSVVDAFGDERYGYVVTPNSDHMIRLHESQSFRALYAKADFVLLDSRVAAFLIRLMHGIRMPVCPGSDLTAAVLGELARANDRIVMIGGSEQQANDLRHRYGLTNVRHHNPKMGFINDPAAREECLQFVEAASPFRFCLIGVGCPQQEVIASLLAERGKARGLALCVGASLNFLTGVERRAPMWMQRSGLEWLYRLTRNPSRLAWRYLVRGPKILVYVGLSEFVLRASRTESA